MNPRAEVAEDAHAPVAHVVEIALDHDVVVVRHRAGRSLLIAEVLHEIARGTFRERVLADELIRRLAR